jgi:hypothetical protein
MRRTFHLAFVLQLCYFAVLFAPRGCVNVALSFCRFLKNWAAMENLRALNNIGAPQKIRRAWKIFAPYINMK